MRRSTIPAAILALAAACYSGTFDASGPDGSSSSSGPGTSVATTAPATTTPGTGPLTGDPSGSGPATTAADEDSTTAAVADLGPVVEPCPDTAFCEPFDDYTEVALADGQTFGPWRATLSASGAIMDLDGAHTTSGDRALHVRLEQGGTSGGRLFTNGGVPLLEGSPTHVYGRLMMYIADNGTSVHWTFFGAQGPAEPSAPIPGSSASYIMSSLPADGMNTYSFVDGLSGGPDYQDCWARGDQPMPTGEWTCVSFEMDGLSRRLRMYLDGDPTPVVAVDDTGQGCVAPVPGDSLWYGPLIERMFVGTWSFHPMDAPLEVWIDDLVVDTAPVACP
ncbi:MAG: hypothetical protein H6712_10935 [Myxococcales bacterium]|nr:hypothetical protein [Myxococcales bacterium]MCB9714365.1 hypothetical protein [Myxococcales bacterium]